MDIITQIFAGRHKKSKVFAGLFQKAAQVEGRAAPRRAPQSAKSPRSTPSRRAPVNSKKRRRGSPKSVRWTVSGRGNPRRGFPRRGAAGVSHSEKGAGKTPQGIVPALPSGSEANKCFQCMLRGHLF